MKILKKYKFQIILIFIIFILYLILILYIHNLLFSLDMYKVYLLVKNGINPFNIIISNNVLESQNSLSPADFEELVIDLMKLEQE